MLNIMNILIIIATRTTTTFTTTTATTTPTAATIMSKTATYHIPHNACHPIQILLPLSQRYNNHHNNFANAVIGQVGSCFFNGGQQLCLLAFVS